MGGGLGRIVALVKARGPFDPSVREHLERLARFNQVDLDSAPPWVQVHLLFDREDLNPLRAAGGEIHGRMGEVVSVRVPVDALEALARVPGVLSVQPARRYNLHMDISRPEMGAEAVTDQFALTGAGTLVAVVDTGIDIFHPDFRNSDGSTRIAAIWDQTDGSGLPPSGFASGTFYSRADIDFALSFMLPLATGDGFGHGTHVTGTAAGNGRGTGNGEPNGVYVGIAHAADILVVRVFDDQASFCGSCDLVAALDFIDQQATALGKPVVVNMSLGSQYGPHDGTETDDLAINAFTRLGRAVVVSAGNSGNSGIHTEGDAVNGGPVTARSFSIPTYTPSGGDGVFMN
ncbi:MAG: S8 family serine peptidase, partial [Acidobacteria bacterium]|nr:S8 family serine peptidase [Acidobacteriota bacterium]